MFFFLVLFPACYFAVPCSSFRDGKFHPTKVEVLVLDESVRTYDKSVGLQCKKITYTPSTGNKIELLRICEVGSQSTVSLDAPPRCTYSMLTTMHSTSGPTITSAGILLNQVGRWHPLANKLSCAWSTQYDAIHRDRTPYKCPSSIHLPHILRSPCGGSLQESGGISRETAGKKLEPEHKNWFCSTERPTERSRGTIRSTASLDWLAKIQTSSLYTVKTITNTLQPSTDLH